MRLDRFITLNLVQPLRRTVASSNSGWRIPVLMYHNISDNPEPGVSPYYRTNTSPAVFRQHMQFLADQGHQTISLRSLVDSLTPHSALRIPYSNRWGETPGEPKLLPAAAPHSKRVLITFDDAFRSVYTEAFPILRQHGFTASVFLPTAFISDTRCHFTPKSSRWGEAHAQPPPPSALRPPEGRGRPVPAQKLTGTGDEAVPAPPIIPHSECLIWSEVLELRRHGIEFGSHTVTHPELVHLGWPEIKAELSDSKSQIEQRLGEPVTGFCYPFAFPQADRSFTETLRGLLVETGYTCCLTTQLGCVQPGDDPFCIRRLPANSLDDAALLRAKLSGHYDWLAAPQSAIKRLKTLVRNGHTRTALDVQHSTG